MHPPTHTANTHKDVCVQGSSHDTTRMLMQIVKDENYFLMIRKKLGFVGLANNGHSLGGHAQKEAIFC